MTPYRSAERWLLAQGLFQAAINEMAVDGRFDREGVAFFLGRPRGPEAHITHLCSLRGGKVNKSINHLQIDAALMNEVTDLSVAEDLTLLGQIHSHAPGYGTDLSLADHFFGIRVPGFISLVAPDFGLRSETRLVDCGVHVFDTPNGFRRLGVAELGQRFGQLLGIDYRGLMATA